MMNKDQLAELWSDYKKTGDIKNRNIIIVHYSSLVKQVAYRLSPGFHGNVAMEDIISFGALGLIDAVDKFNPDKGVKFETYAYFRIRGAVIDQIRQQDWIPRSIRDKSKKMENAMAYFEANYGKQPTDLELSQYLSISQEEIHKTLGALYTYTVTSLDDQIMEMIVPDNNYSTEDSPERQSEINAIKMILSSSIDELSEKERKIISLYYFDELTLKEIGAVLSISESRVSQLHTRSLLKLKNSLQKHKDLLYQ